MSVSSGGRFTVRAAPAEHLRWIMERTGCVLRYDARGIEAVDARGEIRGMIAYEGWTETAVEAHMVTETPAAWRALVHPAFEYPFVQQGRLVIFGQIPQGNVASRRMARKLGFRERVVLEDAFRKGEGIVLVEMRREECRWLRRAQQSQSTQQSQETHHAE